MSLNPFKFLDPLGAAHELSKESAAKSAADRAAATEAARIRDEKRATQTALRDEARGVNLATQQRGLDRTEEMQGDLGSRLGLLRENRDFLSDAAAQPFMQQISEQEGAARRQVGLEGSLGDRRRGDIANQADLARQNVQSQSFGQQIQSEQGLLQLQNDFSGMFNQMTNTQFSEALSGLGEEIDLYMAEKGRDLKYSDLSAKAEATYSRMVGRMASGLGSAFSGNDADQYGIDSSGRQT